MKTISTGQRLRITLIVGVIALGLSACTVTLVSDYDDQIDRGLSDLNTDVTAFVHKMNAVAGQPAGTYQSNQDFYINEAAKIDTMMVRAEAHKALGSCPSDVVLNAATRAIPPAGNASNTISETSKSNINSYIGSIPKDDCSVELIGLIKSAFNDLETFHQKNGSIPKEADDPILVGGLGSLIHSAITVQTALKTSQDAKTSGGK